MKPKHCVETLGNAAFRNRGVIMPAVIVGCAVLMPGTIGRMDHAVKHLGWSLICLGLSAIGLSVRAATVGFVSRGTSGRNTKAQKARRLNTTGMYSVVRNPLYLSNLFTLGGVVMLLASWPILLVFLCAFAALYTPILFVEELFLEIQFGLDYADYAGRVPRLLPRLSLWRPPDLPWSWRMVLRREHDTVFGALVAFVVAIHYVALIRTGGVHVEDWALVTLAVAAALWLTVKILKKRTRLLRARVAEGPSEPARSPRPDRGRPAAGLLLTLTRVLVPGGLLISAGVAVGCARAPVHHFGVVRQGMLYRSGQPGADGWRWLREEYGIRTVISLRAVRPDAPWSVQEEQFCRRNRIEHIKVPIGTEGLTEEQLAQILRTVSDPSRQPVLVHCAQGSSRTGVVVAAYRIAAQGWSAEAAIAESEEFKRRMNPGYAAYLKRLAAGHGGLPMARASVEAGMR
jgi:protein-S-isoprenylcysteine O-methyltransferase Ste14/protein tyrosine phosphatase (PTP) superfamily phosphohydrolase (DUF442 family)